jgi:hypothetical protein
MLKSAFIAQGLRVIIVMNDETLPNFLKESTQARRRKRNKVQRPCERAPKSEPHGGKGTPEYQNFHRWHEAYQLKKVDMIIIVVVQVGAMKYM